MAYLVTGAAGFIGFHVCRALRARGVRVIGVDNFNSYYDPALKEARVALLAADDGFELLRGDISDRDFIDSLFTAEPGITHVAHLAAQAGVRHSLVDPYTYIQSNLMGQVVMLEAARQLPGLRHFVYASSSSVYGANKDLPFSIHDRVDHPVSLYAATKRADELITRSYCHIYGLPATGLRFFTVYGPWGRPDMAPILFADAIRRGKPIRVYNHGQMRRDFTFVDDIVAGVLAALDRPATVGQDSVPHRIYNLGNKKSEALLDFIAAIERAMGRKAELLLEPMQPGDVEATYADIADSEADLGYHPTTGIDVGVPRFVEWYKDYFGNGRD